MSEIFTLDSLRDEMEKKYAPVKIDVEGTEVVLNPVMRLNKKDRKKVLDLVDTLDRDKDDDEEGQSAEDIDHMEVTLRAILTAVGGAGGAKLVTAIGDDLALLTVIFEKWMEATQPGEALNSPA